MDEGCPWRGSKARSKIQVMRSHSPRCAISHPAVCFAVQWDWGGREQSACGKDSHPALVQVSG